MGLFRRRPTPEPTPEEIWELRRLYETALDRSLFGFTAWLELRRKLRRFSVHVDNARPFIEEHEPPRRFNITD